MTASCGGGGGGNGGSTTNNGGSLLTITAHPEAEIVAKGGEVIFTVAATGDAPIGYQWLKNGAAITGATDSSYTLSSATIDDDATYSNDITNSNGTIRSNGAVLNVIDRVANFSGNTAAIPLSLASNSAISGYTLENGPAWLSLTNNGELSTASTDYIGAFNADLRITFSSGETQLYSKIVTGYIYPREDQLRDQLLIKRNNPHTLTTSQTADIIKSLDSRVSLYGMRTYKPNGDAIAFVNYFEKYWNNMTTVAYDLASGTVINSFYSESIYEGTTLGVNTRPKDGYTSKYLMMTQMKNPNYHLGITLYDPVTNTFTEDAFTFPDEYSHGFSGSPNLMPDGNISFSGGFNGDTGAGLMVLNPYTGEKTEYHDLGSLSGYWSGTSAADSKYLYVRTGRGEEGYELIRVNRVDKSYKVLFKSTVGSYELIQTKYAAMIKLRGADGYVDGTYYLVDTVSGVGDEWNGSTIDPNCPWGEDVGYRAVFDFYPEETPTLDLSIIPPTASGKTTLWYKKFDADSWNKIDHNITTYPISISRLEANSDGTLYIGGISYGGHIQYDTNTEQVINSSKLPLNPHGLLKLSTGKTVVSGYPNGQTYMIDPYAPWTRQPENYHPSTPLLDDKARGHNPEWIFEANTVAGLKNARAIAEADGKIFIAGNRARDGSNGGGLQWASLDDPYTVLGGWHEQTENYQFHSMVSVDNKYIALSGKGVLATNLPTPTEGRLFIVDATNGQIVRTQDPISTSMTAGAIVSANNGKYEVIGTTSWEDSGNNHAYIYKVDASTGEMVYLKDYVNVTNSSFGIGTSTAYDFKMGPDGFIYTYFNIYGLPILSRVEPTIGGVELIGNVGTGRIAFIDDTIYIGTGSKLTKVEGVLNKELAIGY